MNIQYTIDYLASLNKGLKKTLDNILKHIFRLYWVDAGGIYLFDSFTNNINLICHTGLSKRFVKEVKSYDIDSNQLKVLLKKKSIYTKSSDLPLAAKTLNEKEGILSVAIIPLINGETMEFVGNLNLASKKYEEISEEDKKGVESIARRIVNLILYAQSQEKLKEARLLLEHKVEEKNERVVY